MGRADPKLHMRALPCSCESCGSGGVCPTAGDTLQPANSLLSAVSVSEPQSEWSHCISPVSYRVKAIRLE